MPRPGVKSGASTPLADPPPGAAIGTAASPSTRTASSSRSATYAIEAGIWSIEHSGALDDECHKLMAQKGIWRVGTETPYTTYHTNTPQGKVRFERQVEGMKNAMAHRVKMAFSTDAHYYIPGMDRGQLVIDSSRVGRPPRSRRRKSSRS